MKRAFVTFFSPGVFSYNALLTNCCYFISVLTILLALSTAAFKSYLHTYVYIFPLVLSRGKA